jgi:hypothetical protein
MMAAKITRPAMIPMTAPIGKVLLGVGSDAEGEGAICWLEVLTINGVDGEGVLDWRELLNAIDVDVVVKASTVGTELEELVVAISIKFFISRINSKRDRENMQTVAFQLPPSQLSQH